MSSSSSNIDISIHDYLDLELLQKLQDSFSEAIGVAAVCVAKDKYLTKSTGLANFCKINKALGIASCKGCATKELDATKYPDKLLKFECHLGLTSFIIPISANNNVIGYFICGQVITKDITKEYLEKLISDYNIDRDEYLKAYNELERITNQRASAIANCLSLMANTISATSYKIYELQNEKRIRDAIEIISSIIKNEMNLEDIYPPVSEELANFFGVQRVLILEFSKGKIPVIKSDYRTSKKIPLLSNILKEDELKDIFEHLSTKFINSDDVTVFMEENKDNIPDEIKKYYDRKRVKASLSIPFCKEEDAFKTLTLIKYDDNASWAVPNIKTLKIIASHLEIAFKKAKLNADNQNKKQREKALLDSIPFVAWLKDKNGKYLSINEYTRKEINLPKEEIIGKTDFEITNEANAKRRYSDLQKVINDKKPIFVEYEYEENKLKKHFQGYISPVFNENEEVIGAAGLIKDITNEKEFEQLKSDFIAIVSHELRTPVTSIRGGLELVINGLVGDIPDKAKNLLKIANSNSQRLTTLLDNILDLEKLENDDIKLDFSPNNIDEMINYVINLNHQNALDSDIGIETTINLNNTYANVDKNRFIQVINNLLNNAIKYSTPQSTVKIQANIIEKSAKIEITNYGKTIPENSDYIFSKFCQLDAANTRRKGGIGIGMTIAKLLIEKMNGSIGYTSNDGETTFFILIPIIQ